MELGADPESCGKKSTQKLSDASWPVDRATEPGTTNQIICAYCERACFLTLWEYRERIKRNYPASIEIKINYRAGG